MLQKEDFDQINEFFLKPIRGLIIEIKESVKDVSKNFEELKEKYEKIKLIEERQINCHKDCDRRITELEKTAINQNTINEQLEKKIAAAIWGSWKNILSFILKMSALIIALGVIGGAFIWFYSKMIKLLI